MRRSSRRRRRGEEGEEQEKSAASERTSTSRTRELACAPEGLQHLSPRTEEGPAHQPRQR